MCSVKEIPLHVRSSILTSVKTVVPDDICRLELLALCLGICLALQVRRANNDHVVLLCDNSAAVRSINRCYSSRFRMSILLRDMALVLASQTYPLAYKAKFVKGENNILADALSRGICTLSGPKCCRFDIQQLFDVLYPPSV
mmetsp:Transcript_14126/g.11809  ORF Transcript_14126/g.11809 Transcript_14126/m.11809 type:complete len:142 (+) Transcript_14126:170-595(+)